MIIVMLGRIGQIFLAFLTVRIATMILLPEEMARVFLISSVIAFFAATLVNPVGVFITRRLYSWGLTGKIRQYFNYFWLYLIIISFIATVLTLIFVRANLLTFHTNIVWLLLLVFCSLIASTINSTIIPSMNLLGYKTRFVYFTLATAAASLIIAVFMLMLIKPKAEYWLVGLLLGQLLVGIVGGKIFYRLIQHPTKNNKHTTGVQSDHVKLLWRFAWPILVSAILIWMQTQSYRFFMENSLGLIEVGLFVAGYGISSAIISAVESVFTTYFQPIFYKRISIENISEQGKAWTNYASVILPSLILVGFFIVATAPELTKFMLGVSYRKSSQFIVWGVIAELARVANNVYGMIAHTKMNTKLLLLPNMIGVVVSIATILWLMPKYGTTGAGIALALAGITTFISTYFATRVELITALSYTALIKSLVVGVLLLLAAIFARSIFGTQGVIASLLLLGFLAAIFLSAQYWMLRSLLHRQEMTND